MTDFVVGFAFDKQDESKLVLVRKLKPAWMAGKLNGIGGAIEPGETPMEAMKREWAEEVPGVGLIAWREFAVLKHCTNRVYYFSGISDNLLAGPNANDIGEPMWIVAAESMIHQSPISNLLFLVPLARDKDIVGVTHFVDNTVPWAE